MDWVLAGLIFLHIFGAILAFGPGYSFMILGPMAGAEPQHAGFAIRFQRRVSVRMILPLALFQGVTGLLLVWKTGINLFTTLWLLVAIVLYVIALAVSIGVGLPTLNRLVALTSAPPPQAQPGAAPPARTGPPPEVAALVRRGRLVGITQSILVVLIVFLMVTKPF
jgi:uncharacterized membrane protein